MTGFTMPSVRTMSSCRSRGRGPGRHASSTAKAPGNGAAAEHDPSRPIAEVDRGGGFVCHRLTAGLAAIGRTEAVQSRRHRPHILHGCPAVTTVPERPGSLPRLWLQGRGSHPASKPAWQQAAHFEIEWNRCAPSAGNLVLMKSSNQSHFVKVASSTLACGHRSPSRLNSWRERRAISGRSPVFHRVSRPRSLRVASYLTPGWIGGSCSSCPWNLGALLDPDSIGAGGRDVLCRGRRARHRHTRRVPRVARRPDATALLLVLAIRPPAALA